MYQQKIGTPQALVQKRQEGVVGPVVTGEGEDRTRLGLPEGCGHLVICTSYTTAEAVVLFSRVHRAPLGPSPLEHILLSCYRSHCRTSESRISDSSYLEKQNTKLSGCSIKVVI